MPRRPPASCPSTTTCSYTPIGAVSSVTTPRRWRRTARSTARRSATGRSALPGAFPDRDSGAPTMTVRHLPMDAAAAGDVEVEARRAAVPRTGCPRAPRADDRRPLKHDHPTGSARNVRWPGTHDRPSEAASRVGPPSAPRLPAHRGRRRGRPAPGRRRRPGVGELAVEGVLRRSLAHRDWRSNSATTYSTSTCGSGSTTG